MSLNIRFLVEEISQVSKGCLMIDMKGRISNWKDITKIIDPDDVYNDDTDDYGIEDEPHITVLYGFDPHLLPSHVEDFFSNVNQNIKFKILGVGCFEGGDKKPYDVVKFDIESEDLVHLNQLAKQLPNETTFPDYKPHMTIAYVKAGRGQRYVKKLKEQELDSNSFIYSVGGKNSKNKTKWKIKKKYKYPIEINENIK